MKSFSPLIIGLPILLARCSTLPDLSSSSFSPFHGFGERSKLGDQDIGDITAATTMTQLAMEEELGGDYRLRGGMETRDGDIVSAYQALSNGQVKLTVYGLSSGLVAEVMVADAAIGNTWGVKIGTPFSAVYQKAYGACHKISSEDHEAWYVRPRKAATSTSVMY